MTAVTPNPFRYSVTYSFGESNTEVTIKVTAHDLTDTINALTELFQTQGCPIKIITVGGSND